VTEVASPQAGIIEWIWWLAVWGATAVFVLTVGALAWATFRRNREASPDRDPRTHAVVLFLTGVTAALLLAFLVTDLFTHRALAESKGRGALEIQVTAQQWWWDVEYVDGTPSRRVHTANEIHVPVGRPIRIVTRSADVIHSIWVPSLQGKRDLVPAHETDLWLRVDEPGVYRGQCAEFCGYQHAKMRVRIIAQPAAEFEAWYAAQLTPAAPPADPTAARGRQVFLEGACVLCHTVRGTSAGARTGPDLTHLASRETLAAGVLPNTPSDLTRWILDPQAVKPGARMPPSALEGADLEALLAFLGSLR
jgi:cytochrome c oxidase subunit II